MSMSATNGFRHPTAIALNNIHAQNTRVFWTTAGNGAPAGSFDVVANGPIVTDVVLGGATFTMSTNSLSIGYSSWPSNVPAKVGGLRIGTR